MDGKFAPIALGISVASLLMTGYCSYNHNDRDILQRVSVLEAHGSDEKDKINHIQEQVDKLVEWALGHK